MVDSDLNRNLRRGHWEWMLGDLAPGDKGQRAVRGGAACRERALGHDPVYGTIFLPQGHYDRTKPPPKRPKD